MKSIYILMHQRKPNVKELAVRLAAAIHRAGMHVSAEPWLYSMMGENGENPFDGFSPDGCDAIFSVGGDGTLLRANTLSLQTQLPILGVNIGRVGFLTEIEMDELDEACERLSRDAYAIENRMMLEAEMNGQTFLALNDVVISRGGYSRLIELNAWVGEEPIGRYVADGLIVSTPTGSTGYSLSAGGPIVCPAVECMMITPICAHSLQHRPVVTSAAQTITIRLHEDMQAVVSIDGREAFPICSSEPLILRRAQRCAQFIRLNPGSFFSKIRIKLSEWSC